MAKAQGKKATQRSYSSGPRRTSDAEQLAALRWLTMKIEQLCIEILVTDNKKFAAVENALRAQVQLLKQLGKPTMPVAAEDCPGGYILCRDGLCAPMCDDGAPPAVLMLSAGKSRRRKR